MDYTVFYSYGVWGEEVMKTFYVESLDEIPKAFTKEAIYVAENCNQECIYEAAADDKLENRIQVYKVCVQENIKVDLDKIHKETTKLILAQMDKDDEEIAQQKEEEEKAELARLKEKYPDAMSSLFDASPEELGKAAVAEARKGRMTTGNNIKGE